MLQENQRPALQNDIRLPDETKGRVSRRGRDMPMDMTGRTLLTFLVALRQKKGCTRMQFNRLVVGWIAEAIQGVSRPLLFTEGGVLQWKTPVSQHTPQPSRLRVRVLVHTWTTHRVVRRSSSWARATASRYPPQVPAQQNTGWD